MIKMLISNVFRNERLQIQVDFRAGGVNVPRIIRQLVLKSRFKGGLIINSDGINLHLIQLVFMGSGCLH